MSSEGHFDVEFNEDLTKKLRNLLELPLDETRDGIQQALNLLEQRNERRRLELTDEISRMPAEMRCAVFRHVSDSDLVDTIIAYEELESTAGLVLKNRKYEAMLVVRPVDGMDCGDLELHMKCGIRKADRTNDELYWITKMLDFSTHRKLSDYVCGFLRVVILFMSSSAYRIFLEGISCSKLFPEKYFGPAATDVTDKSACGRLLIDRGGEDEQYPLHLISSAKLVVFSVCTSAPVDPSSSLTYNADPQLLFDSKGDLTIEGVNKVHLHIFSRPSCNVNAVMMCKAESIELGRGSFWSRLGFNAALTEHANSGKAGKPRKIQVNEVPDNEYAEESDDESVPTDYLHQGWSMDKWIQRYDDWRAGHVAEFGEPGRDVTYEAVRDEDEFKLTLH